MDVIAADKTNVYFVQETIHGRVGLPSFGNTIGPSAIQVVKKVLVVAKERDKTNGELYLLLVFNGNTYWVNAINDMEEILPESFSEPHKFNLPNITNYGDDPFPEFNLYHNMNASFFIRSGGTANPEAWAIFNIRTKETIYIESAREYDKIMKDFERNGILPLSQ